jgi:hypothetical protein
LPLKKFNPDQLTVALLLAVVIAGIIIYRLIAM